MTRVSFLQFEQPSECLQRLAADITTQLKLVLSEQATASMLLPGGRSPQALLPLLAQADVPWFRVILSPTDERWVPADDPHSNLELLRKGLSRAEFIDPRQAQAAEAAAQVWAEQLQAQLPFAAVLLGMGEDGHCASLFPQMSGLDVALDVQQHAAALVGKAPQEPRTRLSLNLSMLLSSRWIALLAFGQCKRDLIDQVLADTPNTRELPIYALIKQQRLPLHIYWAP